MTSIWKKITQGLEILSKDHITESSAQCAYYVILSFIPFIILLLTLIQYTSIDSNQLFDMLSNIIPVNMQDTLLNIVREVYSKSIGTVSISLIFTLISANKGLFALTKELHLIYNYSENKKRSWIYLKLTSIIQTALFIIIIVLSMIFMVFGKRIIKSAKENLGMFQNYTIVSEIISRLMFIIVAFIIFLLVYKFMSRHKIKLKHHIRGAIFSSILLNIVSYVFSKFLEIFKGFSTTYGSLTSLMLIMMWIYTVFLVIFLGAEINKMYNKEENGKMITSLLKIR